MERAEWLKQMRDKAEALYDCVSPEYWVNFGLYPNETHREYLHKFLGWVAPHSSLLSAACGAGRYDGLLLEAGHSVVGIDQSAGMLAQARGHFLEVRYEKLGLQEMDFREAFDGAICMDALEHVCGEGAGTAGGVREVADQVEEASERVKALRMSGASEELSDVVDGAVYGYFPSLEQVRAWLGQAGLAIEGRGRGMGMSISW